MYTHYSQASPHNLACTRHLDTLVIVARLKINCVPIGGRKGSDAGIVDEELQMTQQPRTSMSRGEGLVATPLITPADEAAGGRR
jgi:hypothetical protein